MNYYIRAGGTRSHETYGNSPYQTASDPYIYVCIPLTGERVGAGYRRADLGELQRRHSAALLATRAEHADGPRRSPAGHLLASVC